MGILKEPIGLGPFRIEEVAAFLASGRTVITNTYHGAYWATLLGRRVVVYEPWCTKFDLMRYPLVECTRTDRWDHVSSMHSSIVTINSNLVSPKYTQAYAPIHASPHSRQ